MKDIKLLEKTGTGSMNDGRLTLFFWAWLWISRSGFFPEMLLFLLWCMSICVRPGSLSRSVGRVPRFRKSNTH